MVSWKTQTHLENIINTFPARNSFYLQYLWKQAETLSLPPSQMAVPAGAYADTSFCKVGLKHHHKMLLDKRLSLTSDRSDQH